MAGCLFDRLDSEYPARGFPPEVREYIDGRLRKDRLSAFWTRLVRDTAMRQVQQATSKEEEAIAYLSAHLVEDACGALVEGRDFRLATLVSMIGGDESIRRDMGEQLDEWRRSKMLSEMSEPIRALYELLAGNTSVCEGYKGALEDRARTFTISQRFRLNWKQALGLRLWYGIREEDPLQVAVHRYAQDLAAHVEDHARPVPWFVEHAKTARAHGARKGGQQEDLLWGILKIFADHVEGKQRYKLEDIIMPQNHQLSPVDFRLAWQLYQAFHAMHIADFAPGGTDATGMRVPSAQVAQLTLDFAWQLETAGEWRWAVWVALHLADAPQRVRVVQALLARHGGAIGDGPGDAAFKQLAHVFFVPEAWLWEAKALHARSVRQDHVREVEYLLRARNWAEAHDALVRRVAPRAVIADNTAVLARLLGGVERADLVRGWDAGGQVYMDYLRLLELSAEQSPLAAPSDDWVSVGGDGETHEQQQLQPRGNKNERQEREHRRQRGLPLDTDTVSVVNRLLAALPAWSRNGGDTSDGDGDGDGHQRLSLHQRVAVQEMSSRLARFILDRAKKPGCVSFFHSLLSSLLSPSLPLSVFIIRCFCFICLNPNFLPTSYLFFYSIYLFIYFWGGEK